MRLIDADKLHKEIGKLFPSKMPYDYTEDDNDLGTILCDIGTIIDNQPTVDEKPVIHAKWELQHCESRGIFYVCSNCEHGFKSITECCPHCGAKMDEMNQ